MERVIIYDSDCGLCKGVVRFIRRRSRGGDFYFVAQQSDEGKSLIDKLSIPPEDTNTVILITKERYVLRSTAVLYILKDMGWPWRLFYVFRVVPVSIRDGVYRFVARNRRRVFRSS